MKYIAEICMLCRIRAFIAASYTQSVFNSMAETERCVLLIDMDCFYVQVEHGLQPHTHGQPAAVIQYKAWRGGGIIAVNYEARAVGIRRGHHSEDALKLCPHVVLFRVPERGGKADLNRYRQAGARVLRVLQRFSSVVERASIDEAYLQVWPTAEEIDRVGEADCELLENTLVVGLTEKAADGADRRDNIKHGVKKFLEHLNSNMSSSGDRLLAAGAVICERIRRAVYEETGYRCSAGVAHNKLLAKFCASMNKPNGQTVLMQSQVAPLFATTPLQKLRHLGGKLGNAVVEQLQCQNLAELAAVDVTRLQAMFDDKTGRWLHQLARGIDCEPVVARLLPKSIGCGRNFRGAETLRSRAQIRQWLGQLAEEISERLETDTETNGRRAASLTVTATSECGRHMSRSTNIRRYSAEHIAIDAFRMLAQMFGDKQNQESSSGNGKDTWRPGLVNISICASRFVDHSSVNIADMLAKASTSATTAPNCDEYDEKSSSPVQSRPTDALQPPSLARRTACHKSSSAVPDIGKYQSAPTSSLVQTICDPEGQTSSDAVVDDYVNIVGSQGNQGFFALKMSAESENAEDRCGFDDNDDNNTDCFSLADNEVFQQQRIVQTSNQPSTDTNSGNTVIPCESPHLTLDAVPGCSTTTEHNGVQTLTEDGIDSGGSVCADTTPCPRCDKLISPWILPEHLDWHLAVELSRETNQRSPSRKIHPANSVRGKTRSKRARTARTNSRQSDNSQPSLHRYFSTS